MPKLTTTLRSTSLLFFFSGLTGLVYEVVWFKRFSYLWGNSSLAMAAVVASFLCGLGLGAWLLGAFADRWKQPIAAYGWCELAIGAFAIVVPFEVAALAGQASPLSSALGSAPGLHAIARFGLTFLVLGPPCMCMGATLPLLTRQLTTRGVALGASTAWLYAFNSLGAAAGAWLAGFYLLPVIGLGGTNALAVVLNVAVGVGALAVARKQAESAAIAGSGPEPSPPLASTESVPRSALFTAATLTGCAALVLQMLWTRQLALLLGGSTYAFSATLFVFILGLGLGSLVFRLRWTKLARLEVVISGSVALIVVATLLGLWLMPQLALLVGYLQEPRYDNDFNALVCAAVAAVLEAPATFGMGVLFPALVQLTRQDVAHTGRAVGRVYAFNTLGAIVGASCAALVLLPALGSFWSFRLALAGYAVVPALLYRARSLALSVAILCGVALVADWRPPDPTLTNLGLFMYGPQAADLATPGMQPVFFKEGASSNVLVLQGPDRIAPGGAHEKLVNLRVNGKIDASTAEDMGMQLALAYWPRFLRPRAKSVLVIGMGSGTSAGASALFPTTQVTCCEIEPAIAEAALLFDSVNHRAIGAANVEVVFDDGRSRVQSGREPIDLILSEPSNPWIAGVSNLFTAEFYAAVRERLGRDGVFAQWIQTYAFSPREYALVSRTLTSVFAHCAFVRVNAYDTLILASSGTLLPAAPTIDESQRLVDASTEVRADLQRWFGTINVRELLLSRTLLDERGLARFLASVGGNELNTDSNLRLEFDAPRRLFHPRGDPGAETMRLLLSAMDVTWQRDLFQRWNCGPGEIGALKELKSLLYQHSVVPQANALVELGLAYEPDDCELLVDRLLFNESVPPEQVNQDAARVVALSPREAYRLGASLAQMNRLDAACVVLDKLTTKLPTSASAWMMLGGAYRSNKHESEALAAFARARELDPLNDALIQLDQAAK
jgi:predicted membrane-bound spermidine synthase